MTQFPDFTLEIACLLRCWLRKSKSWQWVSLKKTKTNFDCWHNQPASSKRSFSFPSRFSDRNCASFRQTEAETNHHRRKISPRCHSETCLTSPSAKATVPRWRSCKVNTPRGKIVQQVWREVDTERECLEQFSWVSEECKTDGCREVVQWGCVGWRSLWNASVYSATPSLDL